MKEKNHKIRLFIFSFATALIFLFPGCVSGGNDKKNGTTVVCTIFPIYDWVSEITKGCNDINVILLEDNGSDMHSYQPSIQDFAEIEDCDLFIYIGGESEEWAKEFCEKNKNSNRTEICLMDELSEFILEESEEGIVASEESEESGESENDEHIWLSLRRSILCVDVIEKALTDKTLFKDTLSENKDSYIQKLSDLDKEYDSYFAENERLLIVADRFPFRYLSEDYGFDYIAAFPGCSAESNVSFETITVLSEKFANSDEKVIYITESGDEELAQSVAAEAGKEKNIRVLDSIQSVSSKGMEEGISYYGLMRENLDVLKE